MLDAAVRASGGSWSSVEADGVLSCHRRLHVSPAFEVSDAWRVLLTHGAYFLRLSRCDCTADGRIESGLLWVKQMLLSPLLEFEKSLKDARIEFPVQGAI